MHDGGRGTARPLLCLYICGVALPVGSHLLCCLSFCAELAGRLLTFPVFAFARHTHFWISDDDALSVLHLIPFCSFLAAFMTAQALAHPANVRKMIANGDVEPVRDHSSPFARIVIEGSSLCCRPAHFPHSSTRRHVVLPRLRTAHVSVCVCGLRASFRKRSEGGEEIGVHGLLLPRLALPAIHLPCDVSGGAHPAIVIGRVRAWTLRLQPSRGSGFGLARGSLWRVASCDNRRRSAAAPSPRLPVEALRRAGHICAPLGSARLLG